MVYLEYLIVDCKYGDKTNCADVQTFPGYCYKEEIRNACCATCKTYGTGPQGNNFIQLMFYSDNKTLILAWHMNTLIATIRSIGQCR